MRWGKLLLSILATAPLGAQGQVLVAQYSFDSSTFSSTENTGVGFSGTMSFYTDGAAQTAHLSLQTFGDPYTHGYMTVFGFLMPKDADSSTLIGLSDQFINDGIDGNVYIDGTQASSNWSFFNGVDNNLKVAVGKSNLGSYFGVDFNVPKQKGGPTGALESGSSMEADFIFDDSGTFGTADDFLPVLAGKHGVAPVVVTRWMAVDACGGSDKLWGDVAFLTPHPVPEPAAIGGLGAMALVGLGLLRRRRRAA